MSLRQKNHVTLMFDFIKLYSFSYLVLRLLSQNQWYDHRVLTQTQIEVTQSISLLDGWTDGWTDLGFYQLVPLPRRERENVAL